MDGSGSGWKRAHEALVRLARARAGHDAEEAGWLLEGLRLRVHERVGCGSFLEYLERTFGYGPRLAREKLRVAEVMERLTALRDSLAAGALSWSAVREISRVAVADTCDAWIDRARGRTLREIEDMVSGRLPGALPGDPAEPGLRRHVLRLEITGDAMAAFRDARRALEDDVGHSLEDDELVRMLAHAALGSGEERGRAAYQIAMMVCERCGAGSRDGGGRTFEVDPRDVDMARCDARLAPPLRPAAAATATIGAIGRDARSSMERPKVDPIEPGAPPTGETTGGDAAVSAARSPREVARLDADAVAADGGSPDEWPRRDSRPVAGDIGPETTHVGRASALARTLETISPRVRRAVWRRDHGRCAAPGCRASRFLEVHHVVPRSDGGSHDPSNLLLLCSAHHRRVHDGTLEVHGLAPDGLVFRRRARGPAAAAGDSASPTAAFEAPALLPPTALSAADVAAGLRRLGFAGAEARAAVHAAVAAGAADVESMIRGALRALRASSASTVVTPRATPVSAG